MDESSQSRSGGDDLQAGIRDGRWAHAGLGVPLQLSLATFGILALELAIIRWASGQVQILAYFNNLILIAAFLGMGLGVALGRRYPGLVHWTLPALAVLSPVLAFAPQLGLSKLTFPDTSISLWGADVSGALATFAGTTAVVLALFWAIAGVFVLAGSAVGHLFGQIRTLRAYTYDLLGSVLGVVGVTLVTATGLGPHAWLGIGALPFLVLSRRVPSVIAFVLVLAAGYVSIDGAIYSPYNRIDIAARTDDGSYVVNVNRDFHQYMQNLAPSVFENPFLDQEARWAKEHLKRVYDLPFVLNDDRGRALVVAAGTGNDVQGALRNGYDEVYSVDIDPAIIELGRALHPEKPYDDPRVVPIVNDARAFFEQYQGEPFDIVCYGLLDSHAMFSAMSTLRLENFVYTVEGVRAAWKLVAPGGRLVINFSVFAGDWISDRLFWTITQATGIQPVMIDHQMHGGRTYVVSRNFAGLMPERARPYGQAKHTKPAREVRRTSDDWPFLYVRPGQIPWGYLTILAGVLLTGTLAAHRSFEGGLRRGHFDLPLFLMGAAFLLLETRGVTTLSLLFGSTWIVNSSVFFGILVMVLVANVLVDRFEPKRILPWFVPLLLSVVFVMLVKHGLLNQYPLLVRGVAGGLLVGLPVAFAGVIVSMLLARSSNPSASLGSNLLGSLVGGCLEYLSMWVGLRAMAGVALLLYGLTLLILWQRGRGESAAGAGVTTST